MTRGDRKVRTSMRGSAKPPRRRLLRRWRQRRRRKSRPRAAEPGRHYAALSAAVRRVRAGPLHLASTRDSGRGDSVLRAKAVSARRGPARACAAQVVNEPAQAFRRFPRL